MSHEDREWFIMRPEIRSKALRLSDLFRLADRGALKGKDLIRHSEWDEWIPAGEFPDLQDSFEADDTADRSAGGTGAGIDGNSDAPRRRGWLTRLGHELATFAVVALYLWFILLMLHLHEQVVLDRAGVTGEEPSQLWVHALILGKVVLVAEIIRIGARLPWPNALLSIVFKSILFALVIFGFHLVEDVVVALWNGQSVLYGFSEVNNFRKDAIEIAIMVIALLPYHLYKEVQKQFGHVNLLRLLLRPGTELGGRRRTEG